jgi:hypothetical protein
MHGQNVCYVHGGNARQNLDAARRRQLEEDANRALVDEFSGQQIEPVTNPLEELSRLAGEVVAWKNLLAEKITMLAEWRYEAGGHLGEQLRAEIALFERSLDRCGAVLTSIAKLNIDERLAAIDESKQRQTGEWIIGILAEAALDPAVETRILDVMERRLPELAVALRTGTLPPFSERREVLSQEQVAQVYRVIEHAIGVLPADLAATFRLAFVAALRAAVQGDPLPELSKAAVGG